MSNNDSTNVFEAIKLWRLIKTVESYGIGEAAKKYDVEKPQVNEIVSKAIQDHQDIIKSHQDAIASLQKCMQDEEKKNPKMEPSTSSSQGGDVLCYICGKNEHKAKDCCGVGCYECGELGHINRDWRPCNGDVNGELLGRVGGGGRICYYCGKGGYIALCSKCGGTGHLLLVWHYNDVELLYDFTGIGMKFAMVYEAISSRIVVFIVLSEDDGKLPAKKKNIVNLTAGGARESSQLFIFLYFHRPMGEVPDRNSTIKDSPEGKIDMYTRFIEFANYRIPLSKFLFRVLEYYQINLSQSFVIGVAKVSHFEIMCHASVCPLSIPWFDGTSVVKDPLPMDEVVDLPYVELLNEKRTLSGNIWKPSYVLWVLVVRLLRRTFVPLCYVMMMRVGEGWGADACRDEVPLVTETEDRVVSPSPQTIRLVDHTIQDELNVNSSKRRKRVAFVSEPPPVKKARAEGIAISDSRPSTAGKSPTALRRLSRLSEQGDAGFGSAAPATKDVTSSSVTPTPEHVLEDASHDNVRTRPSSGRFVVLSSGSTDTDIPTSPQVAPPATSGSAGINVPVAEFVGDGHRSPGSGSAAGDLSATPNQDPSTDDFYESQTIDSASAQNVYVPNWNVTNGARINDHVICRNLLDHIADLRVRLEKSEAEAAEVTELRKHVSDLEATVAVRDRELANLHTKNVGLVGKDAAERLFKERAVEMDAYIADVRRDMDNDLYPHMLTAIAGRRWVVRHGFRLAMHKCARSVECQSALGKVISMAINKGIQQGLEAGVVHGKAGRSLTQIEAYDLEVEGKYVVAVYEFEGVSFPLLDELEGLKDSPLALIMSTLTLRDGEGDKDTSPEFSATPGETSCSVPLHDSSLGVADYQVSTLVLSGDGVPAG
ncbi:gypsy type transposase [Tanacetum coccineum]